MGAWQSFSWRVLQANGGWNRQIPQRIQTLRIICQLQASESGCRNFRLYQRGESSSRVRWVFGNYKISCHWRDTVERLEIWPSGRRRRNRSASGRHDHVASIWKRVQINIRKKNLGSSPQQKMVHFNRCFRRHDWYVGVRQKHVRLPCLEQLRARSSHSHAKT